MFSVIIMALQILITSLLGIWCIIGKNVHAEISSNEGLTPDLPKNLPVKMLFPKEFTIGAATSAYQIEGAWNASDKAKSTWDEFVHRHPSPVSDGSNGDVACDSYNKYKEDVRLMKEIRLGHYRFSISWSRILPNGIANHVSQDGLRYYHNLIDELLRNRIEPLVTIYHGDHPNVLDKVGGWTNDLMVDYFADYARIIFREFGHKVKIFSTINEPNIYCTLGYGGTTLAPAMNLTGQGEYLCLHNMLKAHAQAYHIYDKEFRPSQNGSVGIVMACMYFFPRNQTDKKAADIAFEYDCGWGAHPIFSETGDYPEVMKKRIAENSKFEGLPESRLPTFTDEWVEYIRGTADYFGLNHYSSYMAWEIPKVEGEPWFQDKGFKQVPLPGWPGTDVEIFMIVPVGFRKVLEKIKDEYNNPPVIIMENGIAKSNNFNDTLRLQFLHSYLKEMLVAIQLKGCNVLRYTYWSLMDNFEWTSGYTKKFGLLHVNFDDPKRARTRKLSSYWLSDVIRTRKLLPIEDYIQSKRIKRGMAEN